MASPERRGRAAPEVGRQAAVARSVTIFHNPRCSKSRAAPRAAEAAGVDVDVVRYLDEPLDEAGLRAT